MSILFAVICGMIQGATEFLPVSSSGHLALFESFFVKDPDPGGMFVFNVVLHLGTLAAVVVMFRADLAAIVRALFGLVPKAVRGNLRMRDLDADGRMALAVVLGTLPMAAAKLIDGKVEYLSRCPRAVGIILIVNAAMLLIPDRVSRGRRNGSNVTPRTALCVGFSQCVAVLPGLSRSGASVTAGTVCGLDRASAVRFSFILSVPAILGAAVFEIPDAVRSGIPESDLAPYIVGAVTALVCGIAAMKLLIFVSQRSNFRVFSYYCAVLGAASVILDANGVKFDLFR